ncbi:unnamed protein product [Rotaria magnacalcarata]|uniref:Uncharacterized protein n=5 Tax=Rotaria magnacalcarata TaxID=392030 RepID=A0A816QEC7_9BILA|nr:unnamed protein product [Rotaria magnacalcarata]CAF1541912.1 unnamed protein product [Rotaria magnacalcarata]CAF2059393.1 unnamed protein product [Rotaria magnacalcarata]CAF2062842.1 unnamed protein product [Rotaria magnacalcarata]CAF2079936.1 unnamed protein product [Rotaria magnacalcarata]
MMQWRNGPSMNSSGNDYSHLKWPLTCASILTTILAITLLISFRSDSWFTYELIHKDNKSEISNSSQYSNLLEYGTIGLWTICVAQYNDPTVSCDSWTQESRPQSFNFLIILISCALFLSNLTVFPSWGSSILILYNFNNRYTRHIYAFIGILLILTFSFTAALMLAIFYAILTPFYAPGQFTIDTDHLFFHSDQGLYCAGFASVLALICLVLVIITVIWKKMIETKLKQAEKDLLKQLSNDGYQHGWHRIVIAPFTPQVDDQNCRPPPYEYPKGK